jgi:hypothetical protein
MDIEISSYLQVSWIVYLNPSPLERYPTLPDVIVFCFLYVLYTELTDEELWTRLVVCHIVAVI